MRELATLLRENADAYRDRVHQDFFLEVPQALQLFSLSRNSAHPELASALAWFLERCDEWGTPTPAALERVQKLGLDHRRLGFAPDTYTTFAKYLLSALSLFELSASDRVAAEKAITTASQAMRDAARQADLAGSAPAYQARVIEVERFSREITKIRLETALPVTFTAGQHFPVTTTTTHGRWVYLAVAAPPTITGQLEFHVQSPHSAELGAAGALMRSKLGDSWTLGQPRGTFPREDTQVLICFGTGWAPVRSHLVGQLDAAAGNAQGLWTQSVYSVAGSPGQHYDAQSQDNLRHLGLNLTRVVLSAEDPWLLGAKSQASSCVVAPDPIAYILEKEGKEKHFTLVGPAHQVDQGTAALAASGVTAVEAHAWARDRTWEGS